MMLGKRVCVVLVAAFGLLSACKGKTSCKDWAGGYGERSTVSWGDCSDGSKREVECNLLGPGKYECKCMKDGTVVKSFDHTTGAFGDKAKSTETANEMCGWDLAT